MNEPLEARLKTIWEMKEERDKALAEVDKLRGKRHEDGTASGMVGMQDYIDHLKGEVDNLREALEAENMGAKEEQTRLNNENARALELLESTKGQLKRTQEWRDRLEATVAKVKATAERMHAVPIDEDCTATHHDGYTTAAAYILEVLDSPVELIRVFCCAKDKFGGIFITKADGAGLWEPPGDDEFLILPLKEKP